MRPLICTSNTYGHIDYEVPLHARKSTDYRTSTGTYHRQIPCVPQEFDCRVKARIKNKLLKTNNVILTDVKTTYDEQFWPKTNQCDVNDKLPRAILNSDVNYIRNIQEKLFLNPPKPLKAGSSEMKESYKKKTVQEPELLAGVSTRCEISDYVGSSHGLPPEEKGFWKYLDIYLTENRLKYVPYDNKKMEQAAEDIITFYTASGEYKKLKNELPGRLTGNSCVFDKSIFREQYPNKFLSRGQKRVPNLGMQSEYQGHYKNQNYSDLYPYIQTTGVIFPDALAQSSPSQIHCSPGMYCTEYCNHIGSGCPVRSVVDIEKQIKALTPHIDCNTAEFNCEIKNDF